MLMSFFPIFLSALPGARADIASSVGSSPIGNPSTQWAGWGGGILNNRWAGHNNLISSANVLSVVDHCNVSFPVGVSATPVLSQSVAYFPAWNGSFVALDYISCQVLWNINVTSIIEGYAPISDFQAANTRPVSRTSPQVDGDIVYFGTLTHALIVAVDKNTGSTVGIVQIDTNPIAIVTMSPTIFDGKLFVGTSSVEENLTLLPGYQCCSFVGNMVALSFDVATGTFQVLWRVPSISDARHAEGWAGAAFWGSQPSVDTARRQLFVGTGNSYSSSDASVQCQRSVVPPEIPYTFNNDTCLPSDVWQDSVLAIDIDNGHVNWVQQRPGVDIFTAACGYPNFGEQNTTLCPGIPGPDSDFGMAPVYVPKGGCGDKVVVGRKNGDLYAMSAQNGSILWATATNPKGITGGLSWGISVDDSQVYFTAINSDYQTWQLQPSGKTINRSAYGSASLSNGTILWETEVPMNGLSLGPPTVVGDLVLVARTGQDPNGTASYDSTQGGLVVLNKATGALINDFMLSTNFHGGVAVEGPYILFGTGYSGFGSPATVPGGFHVMQVRA
ncbi:Quino protein alcohol dehydrogenase-like protein [Thozetella sp. PMI_491]|nr:Quino protein alcohol dehydrogenase-like protein [Thozetella sp. PMI_491]